MKQDNDATKLQYTHIGGWEHFKYANSAKQNAFKLVSKILLTSCQEIISHEKVHFYAMIIIYIRTKVWGYLAKSSKQTNNLIYQTKYGAAMLVHSVVS